MMNNVQHNHQYISKNIFIYFCRHRRCRIFVSKLFLVSLFLTLCSEILHAVRGVKGLRELRFKGFKGSKGSKGSKGVTTHLWNF